MIDATRSLLTAVDPGFASASDAEVVFTVAVGSMLAWIVLKFLGDIALDAAKFAKGQVDERFWPSRSSRSGCCSAAPRWGLSLAVSVAAAFLVLPAATAVTALLALFVPTITASF
jgi:hypothetical protein